MTAGQKVTYSVDVRVLRGVVTRLHHNGVEVLWEGDRVPEFLHGWELKKLRAEATR